MIRPLPYAGGGHRWRSIVAVTLQDNALATLSQVKEELGNPSGSDDYLKRQINQFSDLFEAATDREYYRIDGHTESVVSRGDSRIFANRRPVLAINTIDVKGSTVDAADYAIEDADSGMIRLKDDFWESTAVATRRVESYTKYYEFRVDLDYDAGYVTQKQVDDGMFSPKTLPGDIERAVITTVATAFRTQGQPSNIDSESIGDASISYAQPDGRVLGQAVSPAFESAASRYQDRSVLA